MAKSKEELLMEENIKNYANEIQSLETFVEAVRKVPGMYIGSKGNRGFITMIKEIFQNCVDELQRASSPCDRITISYDERTHTTILEDNGRGIPFSLMIKIYTSSHTSANYDKKPGEYTSGVHGVGSKVTNALSSSFIVESFIMGEARRVEFIDGVPTKKGIFKIDNKQNKQGTMVMFQPSYEVMGNISVTVQDVLNLIKGIIPRTKIGSTFQFNGIFLDGKTYSETIVNEDGILTDLIMKTTNPLIKPIIYGDDNGTMKAEIAFTYDSNSLDVEDVSSYANFCSVRDGEFLIGFKDGLCNFFRNYMNRIYLANNKKISIVNNDIKAGLIGTISVSHLNPVFTGQAKEILSNEDMLPFVKDLTLRTLNKWSKENPQDLQKLCKYFKEIAEIRLKSEEGKIKLTNKYESSSLSGLPKKYVKPSGNKNLEFIITEGDSAAGSAKQGRCVKRQGIFPVRGKIPNAMTTKRSEFLSNAEIAGMITIIGGGYGKSFDINKVNWEKIIFMPDADPDGLHIRSLLLRFILLYMPQLIEAGMVYAAIPPLFGLVGKGKNIYFTDRVDYVIYCQKIFSNKNEITKVNGDKLTAKEITEIFYKNTDYVYTLTALYKTFAVDPVLLEFACMNIDKSVKELNKLLKKEFRFVNAKVINGVTTIEGLINGKTQRLFINDHLLKSINPILEYIKMNENMYYKLNGQIVSMYTLMTEYESSTPSSIQRYKGLGNLVEGLPLSVGILTGNSC